MHLPPPVHGASMVGKYIHDSSLINEQFDCDYINLAIATSLEDIGQFNKGKLLAIIVLLKNIILRVIRFKPDLVYVTPNAKGGAFLKEFVVVQLLKMMRCKVVAHYHNKGVSTKQGLWLYNLLYMMFFKNIKVILLGKSLYKDIEKYVKIEDVFICPNGIPSSSAFPFKEHYNKVPNLLFLSNLIESKGVLVLLDALNLIKQSYVFHCDFVGGETFEIDATRFDKEIESRGLKEFVTYHGKKYGAEKDKVYQNADIFVFPTYYENECFPLVLLEAMQFGLPCITTNEGAISDIIEDGINGLIAQKRDIYELSNHIITLLTNKELRKKMGNEAKIKFQKEFTLEVFERRFCIILEHLVQ